MRNERGLQFRTLNNYYEIATVIHRKTALFGETCVTESLKMYPESKSLSHSQRITLSQHQTLIKYFDENEQGQIFVNLSLEFIVQHAWEWLCRAI